MQQRAVARIRSCCRSTNFLNDLHLRSLRISVPARLSFAQAERELSPVSSTSEVGSPPRVRGRFGALRHRNFVLFWAGAFLSNTGTWMQLVAQNWLILELTDSPFWLGLDVFVGTAVGIPLTLLGGALADRVSRRALLVYTQIGAGIAALVLGALVYADAVSISVILLATFATGCCMSLSSPSYQAITIDLAGREDLQNAIALNSAQFQFSRVVGPALAGLAISTAGLAACFVANGASYLLVVGALLLVRFPARDEEDDARTGEERPSLWLNLIEGFRYAWGERRLRMTLIISSVVSLFSAPYISLLAVFARDVHGIGERGFSLLMGTAGAGALAGALGLTFGGDFRRKAQAMMCGAGAFGVCALVFAFAPDPMFALVPLFLMGLTLTVAIATANTLLQQLVREEMRGRVMSLFVLSFIGTAPFGNLIAGAFAETRGAPLTLAVCGACVTVSVMLIAMRTRGMWGER